MEMWICVHDHVFGGKSRHLADLIGCSQDEAVGLLVRLWVWGLTNCNREGQVQYASRDTIAEMLVQGLSKTLVPSEIVDCLIDAGYIDTLGDEIYIHDWADWQKYYYSYMDRKENDAKKKRDARAEEAAKRKSAKPPKPPKPPSGDPPPGDPPEPSEPAYPAYFEEWWKAYPRKIGKIDAFKKYEARRKEGYRKEILLEACENYASECKKKKTDKEYMMHPKRFLGSALPFKDYVRDPSIHTVTAPSDGEWVNPFDRWREADEHDE